MKLITKIGLLALTASLNFGNIALAQDSTDTTTEEFPIGTEPEVLPGQTYTREIFGDWELMCIKVAEGPEPCEIGQLILDEQATPVSDVRIFPLPQGNAAIAGATFITPLGVLLQNGVIFGVDDKAPKQYPYQFCNNVGCVARVGLTPLELQTMRKGELGTLTFRLANAPEQPIKVGMSLKGFAAAFAALLKLQLEK